MSKICFISCASLKVPQSTEALYMYCSPLFMKYRKFAIEHFDKIFILSAKYGLLETTQVIEPYNISLNKMPSKLRKKWGEDVLEQISQKIQNYDEITFFCGKHYREYLIPKLKYRGNKINEPTEGLSIGKQLQWINRILNNPNKLNDLNKFYKLISKLSDGLHGGRLLKDCNGNMKWPMRGVYFLFEPNEFRRFDNTQQRIVRVGTHMVSRGSKSTLWNRLITHRGGLNGSGNHRGSIFRLHVGNAIINANKKFKKITSWGKGANAPIDTKQKEVELEEEVSKFLGNIRVIWLAIGDEASSKSDRAYIEKNSIALLTGKDGSIDIPSNKWLGNQSHHEYIKNSGLWNVNYIDYSYDPRFLDIFDYYINVTLGNCQPPKKSIAPLGWHLNENSKYLGNQIPIFKGDNG